MNTITKAAICVAGMGSRSLPATKSIPKEMLPLYDTPTIQVLVEECIEAGCTDIYLITSPDKKAIEEHFRPNNKLYSFLEERNKYALLELCKRIDTMANIHIIYQNEPLGTAYAVSLMAPYIDSNEAFYVLFGDDIVVHENGDSALQQLQKAYNIYKTPMYYAMNVDKNEAHKYGIIIPGSDYNASTDTILEVLGTVEKPSLGTEPSLLACIGKYIVNKEIVDLCSKIECGPDGEYYLPWAFDAYLKGNNKVYAKVLEGVRFDTGDKKGYRDAFMYYANKALKIK